jgi:plastocyanin
MLRYGAGLVGIALAAVAGMSCGSDNNSPSTLTVAKSPTKSGDLQVGPPGSTLPSNLRVIVTRDGSPVSDVTVTWSTTTGSLVPASGQTDATGEHATVWTLGSQTGTQTATATVDGATGSPVLFRATATDDGGPPPGPTIEVLGPAGGNRFDPATITVAQGTTVTWQWPDGSLGHNVAPDAGAIPARSGGLANGPNTYQFTFTTPGTYQYHCEAHGATGMTGTVTVTAAAP